MIAFQRILFPVDFSERSTAAVPSVRAMVKRFGSGLTVLHVVDLPPLGIAPPPLGPRSSAPTGCGSKARSRWIVSSLASFPACR
jgi:nucleotide-binding universal stress UspA family protein